MLETILDNYPDEEITSIDGYNSAIIGFDPNSLRLIYSEDRILEIIMTEDGCDELEAIEHYEYNIMCNYVGEKTPIFCRTLDH
jgi:hypothetical protein